MKIQSFTFFTSRLKTHSISPTLLNITSRCYSTKENTILNDSNPRRIKNYSLLNDVLSKLNITLFNKGVKVNEDTQLAIESFIYDEFSNIKSKNNANTIRGIDKSVFGPLVSNFILSKQEYLNNYIEKLPKSLMNSKKKSDIFMFKIFDLLGPSFIQSQCIYQFLLILTYRQSNDDNINLLACSVKIGKKFVNRYFYKLIELEKENKMKIIKRMRIMFLTLHGLSVECLKMNLLIY